MKQSNFFIQSIQVKEITEKTVLNNAVYTWLLFIDGSALCRISLQHYIAGENDFMLLPPSSILEIAPLSGQRHASILTVSADTPFFSRYLPEYRNISCNTLTFPEHTNALFRQQLLEFFQQFSSQHTCTSLQANYLYFSILNTISRQYIPSSMTEQNAQESRRIDAIKQYIEENYRFPLTLQDLSERFHVSTAHLSRFIKHHTALGFHEYLVEIRLNHAVRDLENTQDTITEIAYANGFPNISSFNRDFRKKFNATPNKYRLDYNRTHPSKPLQLHINEKLSEIFKENSIRNIFRIIDNEKQPRLLHPIWKDMINIGNAANCENQQFQEQLTQMQQRFSFKYAKVTALFKDITPESCQNPKAYPFPNMDSLFDQLRQLRLIPHIDLSIFPGQSIAITQQQKLIREFLKYFIKRYGEEELNFWRFEYSEAPRTDTWSGQRPAQIIENYMSIQSVIKQLLPNAPVGGLSLSPLMLSNWENSLKSEKFHSLLSHMDFFSLHLVPYKYSGGTRQLISDPHYIREFVREIYGMLQKATDDLIPIYVTHCQYDDVCESHASDSAFIAPYLLSVCFLIHPYVQSICFAPFSDIDSHNVSTSPLFFGGNGLVTINGIRKPSWFANFALLRSGKFYSVLTQNCMISMLPRSIYQIIFYNYAPYMGDTTYKKGISQSDMVPQTFTFLAGDMPPGNYRIQKLSIGPNAGSVYDEYLHMNITDDMLPIEQEYLRSRAMFSVKIEYLQINHNSKITEQLLPYEMCIIVLSKITQ